MFSKISKGFGSWQAGYVDPYYGEKRHREHTLPEIDHEAHCHGITVGPHSGRSTAMASHRISREPTSDSLPLPKTYTTRRGALQLYIAPSDDEESEEDEGLEFRPKYAQIKRPSGQELIDLSLKLGTMDRLAMSVLQFGDQEYDHDHTSISDAKNKAFLKFLHSIDNVETPQNNQKVDTTVQPGGDLNSYLKDLRSSSSMRYFSDGSTYIPKSRESMELQAILRGLDNSWPLNFQQDSFSDRQTPGQFTRPVSRVSSRGPSPGNRSLYYLHGLKYVRPPSTPRSTYQVLSTKKLAASIKSGSFLGRPSSTSKIKKTTDGGTEEGSQDDSDGEVMPTLLSDQLDLKGTVEQVSDDTSTFIDDYQPSSEVLADIAPPSGSIAPPSVEEQAELVGIADSSSDKLDSASSSKSVSRRVSDDAVSISAEQSLNGGAGSTGDIVDAQELQREVSAPSADKTDSLSPSANLGSQVPDELKSGKSSVAADDSHTDGGLKIASQAEPESNTQEVTDRNKISEDVPDSSETKKGEADAKIEENTLVRTAVKSAKKERKPPGQITRAGKSTTKPSEETSVDIVEEKQAGVDEANKVEVKQTDKDTAIGKESEGGKGSELVDQASSVDQSGEGLVEENTDVPLQTSTAKEAFAIASELDALGLRQPVQTGKKKGKKEKGSKYVPPPPPSKRVEAPKEEAKIPDHLKDLLNRQPTASTEYLEKDLERRGFLKDGKVTSLVDESLSGPTLEAVGEGLTEEELELAKQILLKKIEDAKGMIDGKEGKPPTGKKKAAAKGGKKGGKKKKGQEETRTDEEIERDMIRHKHDMDKQSRDKEAAELQRKIQERKMMLKMQENMADEKQKEIREKMEQLEREADDLQRAEDEARDILADVRRKQREEREARRKADLERKRNEATERREREKKEMEDKRKKESDMLEKIADAEMRRRLREEEERKAYEAERLAQEKYDEEMREAQRMEEEEEERLKEMERQAEEEAMQRLIEERETAERQRRRLMEEEEALRETERKKMEIMMEEEKKLEEARLRMESAELAKREMEKMRLLEKLRHTVPKRVLLKCKSLHQLRRLEEEARQKMQEEIEKRRNDALARRDHNLENKVHVDKLRHGQGITRAWTFSYFVHWPRETYERPMGGYDPRKAVIKNPPPKAKVDPPQEGTGQPNPEAT